MTKRLLRVRELLRQELGSMIVREHAFPGVLVTINDLEITPDLKHCTVYIGVIGSAQNEESVLETLNRNRTDYQAKINKRVVLRNTPVLHFKIDHSVERGVRVTAIMNQIDAQIGTEHPEDPDASAGTPQA